MYKLIVVDDEPLIRKWIYENINWNENGFEFAGDCEDGNEAIELIEEKQPDVILTDICMPFLDGLELSGYVMHRFPNTKVILLTGYDNFDYAQKAVKLNVYDYILKPITIDDLKKILSRVKIDIENDRNNTKKIEELKQKLTESLPLLRERLFNKCLYEKIDEEELKNRLSYLGVVFKYQYLSVLVISIDCAAEIFCSHEEEKYELLLIAVSSASMEIISRHNLNAEVFNDNNDNTVIVLNSEKEKLLKQKKIEIAENIRQCIEQTLSCTVTIGIGTVVNGITQLAESYNNAKLSLDYRFLLGTNQIIHYMDIIPRTSISSTLKNKWAGKLYYSLKISNKDESSLLIKKIFLDLKSGYIPMNICIVFLQKIIASICSIIDELDLNESEIFEDIENPFSHLSTFETLDALEQWLKHICEKINFLMEKRQDSISRKKIEEAKRYMLDNYNSEEINLNSICNYLAISTSKFSQILKKFTGQTFIEYLTRVRIEKAMEMLKSTDNKIYEIAFEVGFNDPHYFSFIFKKVNGISPVQFRERIKRNVNE